MVGMSDLKDITKALPTILKMTQATTDALQQLADQLDVLIALQRQQIELMGAVPVSPPVPVRKVI